MHSGLRSKIYCLSHILPSSVCLYLSYTVVVRCYYCGCCDLYVVHCFGLITIQNLSTPNVNKSNQHVHTTKHSTHSRTRMNDRPSKRHKKKPEFLTIFDFNMNTSDIVYSMLSECVWFSLQMNTGGEPSTEQRSTHTKIQQFWRKQKHFNSESNVLKPDLFEWHCFMHIIYVYPCIIIQ